MKKTRHTDSQIIAILKQNESGTSVAELCREHGMSQASFYKWRSKYGRLDAKRLHNVLVGAIRLAFVWFAPCFLLVRQLPLSAYIKQ